MEKNTNMKRIRKDVKPQGNALLNYLKNSEVALDYLKLMTDKYGDFRGVTWAPSSTNPQTYPKINFINGTLSYYYSVTSTLFSNYSFLKCITLPGELKIPYSCSFTVSFNSPPIIEGFFAIGTNDFSEYQQINVNLAGNIFPAGTSIGNVLIPHRNGVFAEISPTVNATTLVPGTSVSYQMQNPSLTYTFREYTQGIVQFGVNNNFVTIPKNTTAQGFQTLSNRQIILGFTQVIAPTSFTVTMVKSPSL